MLSKETNDFDGGTTDKEQEERKKKLVIEIGSIMTNRKGKQT